MVSIIGCTAPTPKTTKNPEKEVTKKWYVNPLPQIQTVFDSLELKGSFIWYDLNKNKLYAYGDSVIYQRQCPASTFKILNALIILQEGVIQDTFQKIPWDKKMRNWDKWNQDQTLPSSIRYSALWAFQEMARRVGQKSDTLYPYYLKKLAFGNQTIGQKDAFWIDNSLKVSPLEQLQFLIKLYRLDLPFDSIHIQTVKEMIKIKHLSGFQMSGKTGWALAEDRNTGWYMGYVEQNNKVYFYVTTVSPVHHLEKKFHFRRSYIGGTEIIITKLLNNISN